MTFYRKELKTYRYHRRHKLNTGSRRPTHTHTLAGVHDTSAEGGGAMQGYNIVVATLPRVWLLKFFGANIE